MALTYSKGLPDRSPAPDFDLVGVDGIQYSLQSFKSARLLVMVFTCNHCPYAKTIEDRLIALQKDYASNGVQVIAINPNDDSYNSEDSFDEMATRAFQKNYPFPYLWDATQDIAKAYNATCTPDFFIFDEHRELRYNGRLDDNWQDANCVGRHDLRDALEALLAGKEIPFKPTPSMGCSIKWRIHG